MPVPKKALPACPVETTLSLLSSKWKVLIMRDLLPGTKRFGELRRSVGNVSQKVLTQQLRDMEDSGLVSRKIYAEVPPRVEYSLTPLGLSLRPVMEAMWKWGVDYKKLMGEPVPDETRTLTDGAPAGSVPEDKDDSAVVSAGSVVQ